MMLESDSCDHTSFAVKTYKRRFLLLILVLLLNLINGFQAVQYTSIAHVTVHYYNVSFPWVTMTTAIFDIGYILAIVPHTYLLRKYGLKFSLIMASFTIAFGASIKCFGTQNNGFWLVLVGQLVASYSQAAVFSLPSAFAASWFAINEVATVKAACLVAIDLGSIFGFLQQSAVFSDISQVKEGMVIVTFVQAILSVTLFGAIVIFMEDSPPRAPSVVQKQRILVNWSESLHELWKNKDFLKLALIVTISSNVLRSILALLNQIVHALFKNEMALVTSLGMFLVAAAVLGGLVCSRILDSTKRFKKCIFLAYMNSLVSTCCLLAAVKIQNFPFMICAIIYHGFTMEGVCAISLDVATELTYPCPEEISIGSIYFLENLMSVPLLPLCSVLMVHIGAFWTLTLFPIMLTIGGILLISMSWDLRRQRVEEETALLYCDKQSVNGAYVK